MFYKSNQLQYYIKTAFVFRQRKIYNFKKHHASFIAIIYSLNKCFKAYNLIR